MNEMKEVAAERKNTSSKSLEDKYTEGALKFRKVHCASVGSIQRRVRLRMCELE
jgi:hypothetical protein